MRITHLGHSCLLLDYGDVRFLVDPGTFSADIEFAEGVDAVLITHQHPDHVDVDRLPTVLATNPGARVLVEPSTVDVLAKAGISSEPFAPGDRASFGSVTLEGVGGEHAVIWRELPRVGNTGLVLRSEGAPTVFHTGDMIDTTPDGIDLVSFPLAAPWCAMKETIEFLRALDASIAVPVHDAIVSPPGRGLYLMQTTNFAPERTTLRDLAGAGPTEF